MITLKLQPIESPSSEGTPLPCERCLCAGCSRTCNQCFRCNPMEGGYIPLIGCPDFLDMRKSPLPRREPSAPVRDFYPLHLTR